MIVIPTSRIVSAISFGVFCRTAPSTRAIMRSRKVEPCAAVIRTLSQSEVTRVPPVTAGGFIDRGDALDDLAVAGDEIAGLDQYEVTLLERRRRHLLPLARLRACEALGLGLRAHAPQRVGLRLAAPFRHRLGEIGEQHGEPQPGGDLPGEERARADDGLAADEEVAQEEDGAEHRDDLDHEHDGVLDQRTRVELAEGGADRRHDERAVEQRQGRDLPLEQSGLGRGRGRR